MSVGRLGILTGGGDCAGLNAVIRAVTKCAISRYGMTVVGIQDGFDGLLGEPQTMSLTSHLVKGLLYRGGTILGSSNKGDPFAYKRLVDGRVVTTDRSDEVIQNLRDLELDALIVVGGDGTNAIALKLFKRGINVVGVPKTIDNDLGATDVTFGFYTAVQVVTEAIDRLQTTAESHHRAMVIETMGRNAGWIALESGLAGGADVILIPEIPFTMEAVAKAIRDREAMGRRFTIICVAEGAKPLGGTQVIRTVVRDSAETVRLGGIGEQIAAWLNDNQVAECRSTSLGHIQRGGTPCAFDRNLCTRLGTHAVHAVAEGQFGQMVVLKNWKIGLVPIEEAISQIRLVDPASDIVRAARDTGVCFGD